MAKSGQSCCTRGCGELIARSTIRLGAPIRDSRGCYGFINAWTHLECTLLNEARACSEDGEIIPERDVYGFDRLPPQLQAEVRAELAKEDREADRILDPNDSAFLKQRALPRVKPPSSICAPLLPYQEEGFGWLREREATDKKAILSDEMGMGKTLQAVALLAADQKKISKKKGTNDSRCIKIDHGELLEGQADDENDESRHDLAAYSLGQTTLVVVPSSALWQWHDEIVRFWVKTRDTPAPQVLVYYQNRDNFTPKVLAQYDVVLTTYPVLEIEFRKQVDVSKLTCKFCRKKMLPRKLKSHLKYQCGPFAQRTVKQALTKRGRSDVSPPVAQNFISTPGLETFLTLTYNDFVDIRGYNSDQIRAMQLSHWESMSSAERQQYANIANSQMGTKTPKPKKLTSSVNTPSRIYQDLMNEAGREQEIQSRFAKGSGISSSKKKKNSTGETVFIIPKKPQPHVTPDTDKSIFSDDDEMLNVAPRRASSRERKSVNRYVPPCKDTQDRMEIDEEENDLADDENEGHFKKASKRKGVTDWDDDDEYVPEVEKGKEEIIVIDDSEDDSEDEMDEDDFVENFTQKAPIVIDIDDDDDELPVSKKKKAAVSSKKKPAVFTQKAPIVIDIDDDDDEELPVSKKKKAAVSSKKKPAVLSKRALKKKAKEEKALKDAQVAAQAKAAEDERIANIDALVNEAIMYSFNAAAEKRKSKKKKKKRTKKPSSASKKKAKKKAAADESSCDSFDNSDNSESSDAELSDDENIGFAPEGLVKDLEGVDLRSSLLHCIQWRRIILDEAHRIKGFTSSTAKAAFALRAESRLCLTGTPLQNRVKELQSLVRFLRIEPYAYYFCNKKGCDCKMLHWGFGSRGAFCEFCGHTPMMHYNYFNRKILKPIEQAGYAGAGARAMRDLRANIINEYMLRRTKLERQKDLELPPLTVKTIKLKLSRQERDFYEAIYKKTTTTFSSYVKSNSAMHNVAHIFELLSGLRQSVDHPYLFIYASKFDDDEKMKEMRLSQQGGADICAKCNDPVLALEAVQLGCDHIVHRDCGDEICEQAQAEDETPYCPICYQKYSVKLDKVRGLLDDDDDDDDEEEDPLGEVSKKKKPAAKVSSSKKRTPHTKETDTKKKVKQTEKTINKGLRTLGVLNKSDAVPLPDLAKNIHDDDDIDMENEQELPEFTTSGLSNNPEAAKSAMDNTCNVCFDAVRDTVLYPCGHACVCRACIEEIRAHRDNRCPMCRTTIRKFKEVDALSGGARLGRNTILHKVDMSKWVSSSKLEAIHKAIIEARQKQEDAKVIVFSQYRSFIDIIEWRLRFGGIRLVKLMGDMPLIERKSVLEKFKTDPSIAVILLSLKAGGEGLNLQVASHVLLCEPWWNPAVEAQAFQRAHRIGQTRQVTALRFITEDTIEAKMDDLQDKKRKVFEGTIDGSGASFNKLSMDDLEFLFSR